MIEQIHKRFNNVVIEGMDTKTIREQIEDENYLSRLERLVRDFKKKIKRQFGLLRIIEIATNINLLIYKYNERRWINELFKFGINLKKDISWKFLKDYLDMRITSNVGLIKNLRDDVQNDLEQMIYRNFEQGKTHKELAKEMVEKFGIDKRKAALIARNEIKNTNTQLNKKRMQEYGIEKAVWDTSEDERVRSQHRLFNQKEYVVGIGLKNEKGEFEEVGEAINCRCVAMPII